MAYRISSRRAALDNRTSAPNGITLGPVSNF